MIPTREEYKIVSDYLISIIDWNRMYDDTPSVTKKKFTKEYIINSLKELISRYPVHYDTSIKGRIEENISVFSMEKGTLNNYMFVFSVLNVNFGWYLTEDKLFETIGKYRDNNRYFIVIDIKEYLRNHKIKKICQTLKQTTNSAPR